MSLTSKAVGSKIVATIRFAADAAPQMFDGVIVGQPTLMTQPTGRIVRVADVILVQENQQGEKYLSARIHNLNFAFDRSDRNELLDGPADKPKTWQELVREQSAEALAYSLAKAEAAPQSLDLDSVEA